MNQRRELIVSSLLNSFRRLFGQVRPPPNRPDPNPQHQDKSEMLHKIKERVRRHLCVTAELAVRQLNRGIDTTCDQHQTIERGYLDLVIHSNRKQHQKQNGLCEIKTLLDSQDESPVVMRILHHKVDRYQNKKSGDPRQCPPGECPDQAIFMQDAPADFREYE